MRKFYLFKLGFLTSTLCNCGLQEAEFQVQNENYGKNLTKSLKDLRTCLQNASYKNRQEQNAIKSNQTTLTGDIAELAKKFESRIKEKENAINTLQEQLIKQSEALDDLNKQKDQLANLKTELTNKIDQSKLDEEIQKHTKELIEKEKEINTLKTQLAQQSKALEDLKQQKDQIEKLENEFKAKGNDIEGLQQEIDDLKKQKEALENKLNEQIKNELKGKVDKTVLDAEIQKHTKELETKLIEKENKINTLKTQLAQDKQALDEALNKQILDLNDKYTETKQKLEKQNLGINRIGTYLVENKPNKKKFEEDWEAFTKTNIVSQRGETRKNSLTKESKPGQEKHSDD